MGGRGGQERSLRRIITMLVALAVLAERAATRSFPIRFLVLFLLRRAEAVACGYVAETTRADLSWFAADTETASRPVDAVLLALRLRMLAALLGAVLGPTRGRDGCSARRETAGQRGGATGGPHRPAASGSLPRSPPASRSETKI